jgi:hypothetical protein
MLTLRGRKIPSKKVPSNYIKKIHLVLFVLLIYVLKNIDHPANFKPKLQNSKLILQFIMFFPS